MKQTVDLVCTNPWADVRPEIGLTNLWADVRPEIGEN